MSLLSTDAIAAICSLRFPMNNNYSPDEEVFENFQKIGSTWSLTLLRESNE
jgi:hypothetical protein